MKRWQLLTIISVSSGLLGLLAFAASSRAQPTRVPAFPFVYEAKFFCTGNIPGTSQTTPSVAPGAYFTAISAHNPSRLPVRMRQRIAITFPAVSGEPGDVSAVVLATLPPGAALQVDCDRITGGAFGFEPIHGVEGFLFIESNRSMSVQATYTAHSEGFTSIAVEQVEERSL